MPANPPEPEGDDALARALRSVLPADAVLASPDERRVYDCDGQTLHRAPPDVVVLPRTHDEVVAAMRVAHRFGVPVVPRGAGTGLSGGTLAPQGGVLISTARMNRRRASPLSFSIIDAAPSGNITVGKPYPCRARVRLL